MDNRSESPLAELSRLVATRTQLDLAERRLIEEARVQGISWSRIASALGLASRQAAEQRWLRLSGANGRDPAATRTFRRRQQIIDNTNGSLVVELRQAVRDASRLIDDDPEWDGRHPRAVLIRKCLSAARDAEPGSLYQLAVHVFHDLHTPPWPALPATLTKHLHRLEQAVNAATPRG